MDTPYIWNNERSFSFILPESNCELASSKNALRDYSLHRGVCLLWGGGAGEGLSACKWHAAVSVYLSIIFSQR